MSLEHAKRILVVGCSGSGKSTLARQIGKALRLSVIHLDVHFWQPDWKETEAGAWRSKVQELVRADSWVMDGTFADTFDIRFPLIDAVVFLDFPRWRCLYRAIRRVFIYNKNNPRPDMAVGCEESFDWQFYRYIWTFNRLVRPQIQKAIQDYDCKDKVTRLGTPLDVERFRLQYSLPKTSEL